jgi:hypothetical protein
MIAKADNKVYNSLKRNITVLKIGCYHNNCILKETERSSSWVMNITTCQETCQKESNCFQWSLSKDSSNKNDEGHCFLGKTSELQSECKQRSTSQYNVTTGQLSCPGKPGNDKT